MAKNRIDAYPDADFTLSTVRRTTMTPCVYAVARAMSSQFPDVPSIGRQNFRPRQPLPPWKLR